MTNPRQKIQVPGNSTRVPLFRWKKVTRNEEIEITIGPCVMGTGGSHSKRLRGCKLGSDFVENLDSVKTCEEYSTQKPLALLERTITTSSNEGDSP